MAENGADGGNQLPSALEEALAHATDKATAEAARLARAFATSRSVEEAESDVDGLQPSTTASDQGESDAVEGSAVSTAAGDQADSTLAAAAILTQTLSVRKILQLYRVYSAKVSSRFVCCNCCGLRYPSSSAPWEFGLTFRELTCALSR